MSHLMTFDDAPNCTWTDVAVRNLSNSSYRGLDKEEVD